MATWSATVLAPLVAALERSQAIVREQAEALGELRATVTVLEAQNATLKASAPPPVRHEPSEVEDDVQEHAPEWTGRWWPVVMLIVAVVLGVIATALSQGS